MTFRMEHFNFNVQDLGKSMEFYEKALGLKEVRRSEAEDGSYIIVFMANESTSFRLELTWLRDHPQKYDIGEEEFHLGVRKDDYEAAHRLHEEMGCICMENPSMGIYFIQDPDGYWIEIIPTR
ncbi:MAG: VOC family protein [Oscillospiraceae bacterium]